MNMSRPVKHNERMDYECNRGDHNDRTVPTLPPEVNSDHSDRRLPQRKDGRCCHHHASCTLLCLLARLVEGPHCWQVLDGGVSNAPNNVAQDTLSVKVQH